MTDRLRGDLQATLGGSYTLERELGGGGMSRVFVAIETSLDRTVVVKVLGPALALAYVQGEGVVHRDIKPENVLLSGSTAVVTDFGIARAISAARTGRGGDRDAHDQTRFVSPSLK